MAAANYAYDLSGT